MTGEPCLNHACRSLLYWFQRQAWAVASDTVAQAQAEWRMARCGLWLDEVHAIQDQAEAVARRLTLRMYRERGA